MKKIEFEGKEYPVKLLFSGKEIGERLFDILSGDAFSGMLANGSSDMVLVPLMNGAGRVAMEMEEMLGAMFVRRGIGNKRILRYPMRVSRTSGSTLLEPSIKDFDYGKEHFEGKDVILVDDLVDEGETLKLARKTLESRCPGRVISVVLVKKTDVETAGYMDFCCFDLGYSRRESRRKWLFGYGMDIDGMHREHDFIAEFHMDEAPRGES